MNRIRNVLVAAVTAICLGAAFAAGAAPDNGYTLKSVDNPGGGQYVYGDLTGKGTLPEAMIYTLKLIHGHFGDRPQLGKFFRSRDDGSVAAFFSVMAKKQGNRPVSGLLIVYRSPDGAASMAVLYDDKARFGATEPAMMKSLFAVWHPAGRGAVPAANRPAPASQGAPAQLGEATGGDRSAAIGLPAGWHLTGVSGGQLTAAGPNGELVELGLIWQNLPFYVQGDLFTVYVHAFNLVRAHNGKPPGTFTLTGRTNLPDRALQAIYNVDFNDNFGPRKGSARIQALGPNAIIVSQSSIPARLAVQENSTLMAVIRSYHQNNAVIAREGQADLARVHADAARANAQADAINRRREAGVAAFDQHMDNIDRGSKVTQDYILDRSVVRDNETSERGTVTDSYADALVKANPNRFEVVPSQGLIRGQDY